MHPLVERIGAALIEAAELTDEDVPLVWRGSSSPGSGSARASRSRARTRAGSPGSWPTSGASSTVPFDELPRAEKQRAVRLLEEAGAFSYRKSVETVAPPLGVSRFTVYNYLNRDRD